MTHRHRLEALLLLALMSTTVLSCVKPNTFNPYAAPDHNESDRLQKNVNDRPDLEVAQKQLADLDGQIRAVITRISPQTVIGPSTPKPDRGCTDPFTHSIGDTVTIEKIYARPAPTDPEWQQITEALTPILSAATFKPNTPPGIIPAASTFSWITDDGATIEMINNPGSVLAYGYSTGCRLPAAWRAEPPPADLRPSDDPNVHYPYLYGPEGGRRT
jgi:Lipoprotein confined to pathogenic Mycobacterium